MSVDAISSSPSNGYQQVRNDFQSLSLALQNDNLTAAQKAFASIQDDQQNQTGPQPPANTQIAKDFSALGDALQAGDLSGAQQAFSALQSDVQSLRQSRGGHGGHHGGGAAKDDADSTDNSQKTVANEVTATNADGTLTVTTTYTDGTTSATNEPNPNPVVSQSPLSSNNTGQLAALLTAQEQAALNPAQ